MSDEAEQALVALILPDRELPADLAGAAPRETKLLARAATQMAEYFAGKRTEFDLPMSPRGTDFQRRVWAQLAKIPFGVTWSYGEVAARIGRPAASRAVGAANGQNPLAILLPCHRVIGSNGSLTGYGGGLPLKKWLLAHERGDGELFAR
ncbi:MAG TPA: methylated-DNA--[protein]-cysteine S-methyltransferase [Kofleriaceae bacterium]